MKRTENSSYHCIVPNGCLVIIGGAERKEHVDKQEGAHKEEEKEGDKLSGAGASVLAAFIDCCRKKAPRIELITTAGNEEIEDTFRVYEACFKKLGAQEVGHIHHNSRQELQEQDPEELRERIRNADGVFISGGDQLKLTSIYGGTPFLTDLKQAYLVNKLVVGGTSAGAMALSTPMIFGGTGENELIAAGVKVTTGMEFLKDVCIDTHFVHRGRFVRMAQVIATNPASIGIGIEEDTAVVVTNGVQCKVVGSGVVILMDGVRIRSSNITDFDEEKKITIRDLEVSILAGDELFEIPQRNPPHQ